MGSILITRTMLKNYALLYAGLRPSDKRRPWDCWYGEKFGESISAPDFDHTDDFLKDKRVCLGRWDPVHNRIAPIEGGKYA